MSSRIARFGLQSSGRKDALIYSRTEAGQGIKWIARSVCEYPGKCAPRMLKTMGRTHLSASFPQHCGLLPGEASEGNPASGSQLLMNCIISIKTLRTTIASVLKIKRKSLQSHVNSLC